MYIISAGNSGMMESAKTVIKQALWGVVIVLGAWVIVNTILWMITSKLYPGTGEEGNKFMDISNWYNFDCEPAVSSDIVRCEMGFGSNPEGTQCVRCSDIGADVHATRPGECLIPCLNGSVRDSTGSCIWNCPEGSHPYPNYDAISSDNNSGICLDDVTGETVPSIQSSQSITPQTSTPTTPQPETPSIPQPETSPNPQPDLPVPPSESTTIPQGEQAVRDYLSGYGIEINNDNACQAGQTSGCTTIAGLREDTVNGVVSLKQGCGDECNVTITGGTEGNNIHVSGEYSHVNGYKVDLRPNAELNDYIETKYDRIPEPRSDGAIGYLDPSGNTYYYEKGTTTQGPHWDVTYLGT